MKYLFALMLLGIACIAAAQSWSITNNSLEMQMGDIV